MNNLMDRIKKALWKSIYGILSLITIGFVCKIIAVIFMFGWNLL